MSEERIYNYSLEPEAFYSSSKSAFTFRRWIWQLLDASETETTIERYLNIFLTALILFNVCVVVLESIDEIEMSYGRHFRNFELFSVFVFLLEYLGRLWSCTASDRYSKPILGRIRFLLTPLALVDLLSIIPSFLPYLTYDLRILRSIRLLRIFRLLKLTRYQHSFLHIASVFRDKREELFITTMLMCLLVLLSGTLMYFAEHDVQPDKFPDIPTTFWWAVMTLTTVGYGDVYPVTSIGKILTAFVAIIGIAFFALPTSILGAGFLESLQSKRIADSHSAKCPHCGHGLE